MEKQVWFCNKITWFSFFFSLLVVWVHSANGELFLGQSPYRKMVVTFEMFLGGTVAQIAVPGFFMLSGYLFYRNFTWAKLWEKWKRRVKSVLVPFLLWNMIYYLGYVIGSRLPFVAEIMGKGRVPIDWHTIEGALFHYTYHYVFWYLYQLIQLIFLAPVLYGVLRRKSFGILALAVLYYVVQKGIVVCCLNLDALFYYSLAAFGGIHGTWLVEGGRTRGKTAAGAGIVAVAVAVLVRFRSETIWSRISYRSMMPVGLWLLVDGEKLQEAKPWMKYNFFLYAVHFALVRLMNKTAARLFPGCWFLAVFLFLAMPGIMVFFSYFLGSYLEKQWPRLWSVLSGGR